MSVAAAIRRMIELGLTVEQALIAAETWEETQAAAPKQPKSGAGAERMRRYREHRVAAGLEPVFDAAKYRGALTDRDGPECGYCGSEDARTVDHIVPTSKGGTDDLGNLVLACNACNGGKSGRPLGGRYQLQKPSAQAAHVRYLAEQGEQTEQSAQSEQVRPSSPQIAPRAEEITYNPSLETSKKNPPTGGKKKASTGSRLPPDWQPDLDGIEYAARHGIVGAWLARETERFRNNFHGKSGRDGTKLDWSATWRNWVLSAADRGCPKGLEASHLTVIPETGNKLGGKFYAKGQSPQFEAWSDHFRRTRGRDPPTDRNGGWWFDSEWPVQAEAAE